jgi:hypothetical protein
MSTEHRNGGTCCPRTRRTTTCQTITYGSGRPLRSRATRTRRLYRRRLTPYLASRSSCHSRERDYNCHVVARRRDFSVRARRGLGCAPDGPTYGPSISKEPDKLNRTHRSIDASNRTRRRFRHQPAPEARHHLPTLPLTPEGLPAAPPGTPPSSPAVFVSEDSRAQYPWLPRRVIAGSVWRGPGRERVKVDEDGRASLWRSPPSARR